MEMLRKWKAFFTNAYISFHRQYVPELYEAARDVARATNSKFSLNHEISPPMELEYSSDVPARSFPTKIKGWETGLSYNEGYPYLERRIKSTSPGDLEVTLAGVKSSTNDFYYITAVAGQDYKFGTGKERMNFRFFGTDNLPDMYVKMGSRFIKRFDVKSFDYLIAGKVVVLSHPPKRKVDLNSLKKMLFRDYNINRIESKLSKSTEVVLYDAAYPDAQLVRRAISMGIPVISYFELETTSPTMLADTFLQIKTDADRIIHQLEQQFLSRFLLRYKVS